MPKEGKTIRFDWLLNRVKKLMNIEVCLPPQLKAWFHQF
jgi:hypothetical protein